MASFNFIDGIVLAIIFISALFAFLRGFIGTTFSLIGWILVAYLTIVLFPIVQPLFSHSTEPGQLEMIMGYVILALILSVVIAILISFITRAIPFHQGMIDRSFGIIIGGLRGLIIVAIIFTMYIIVMNAVVAKSGSKKIDIDAVANQKFKEAMTYPTLKSLTAKILDFLPESVHQSLDQQIESGVEVGKQKAKEYAKEQAKEYVKDKIKDTLKVDDEGGDMLEEGIKVLIEPKEKSADKVIGKLIPKIMKKDDSATESGDGVQVDLGDLFNQLK